MLRAGALFYAVVLALILSIISASFILYSYHFRILAESLHLEERLRLNAVSGINLLMANPEIVPPGEKKVIDLFSEETDETELSRSYWGGFEVITAKAFFKDKIHIKSALAGDNIFENGVPALYLTDQDKPLSLSGNTSITGLAYLPRAGVKRAYIEGQSYTGSALIHGEVKGSSSALPKPNLTSVNHNLDYLAGIFNNSDSLIGFPGDTLERPFSSSPVVYPSSSSIRLDNQFLKGRIILVSSKEIVVSGSSSLEDVVLYAPVIRIRQSFKGNVQAFASDSIIVEKSCVLNYPSVLAVLKKAGSMEGGLIEIGEETLISGMLFGYQENNDSRNKIKVSILPKAVLTGQTYAQGMVDLKGTVHGSLYCNNFILATPSSVYENHLLNATIDATKLSPFFVGADFLRTSAARKIVKWIE